MSGSPTYRLVMRRGPQPNQVYEITKDVTSIGRDITNDIVINDREASRHHLRIMKNPDGFVVEDLGSTNGTFVNSKRLSGSTPLKNGDMVGLGETVTLGFEMVAGAGGVAPEAPVASANPYQAPPAAESQAPVAPEQPVATYQPPAQPSSQEPAPAVPYQPTPAYESGGQQGGSYPPAASGSYQSDSVAGYDYDPYTVREEEGGGRWFVIGCLVFFLLACSCISVVGFIIIVWQICTAKHPSSVM